MERPALRKSRVATTFASTTGLCSGTRQIPVASRIFLVAAAIHVSARNGSMIGASVGAGKTRSCEYGYFDEYLSISTTCSGTHSVEAPAVRVGSEAAEQRAANHLAGAHRKNSDLHILYLIEKRSISTRDALRAPG